MRRGIEKKIWHPVRHGKFWISIGRRLKSRLPKRYSALRFRYEIPSRHQSEISLHLALSFVAAIRRDSITFYRQFIADRTEGSHTTLQPHILPNTQVFLNSLMQRVSTVYVNAAPGILKGGLPRDISFEVGVARQVSVEALQGPRINLLRSASESPQNNLSDKRHYSNVESAISAGPAFVVRRKRQNQIQRQVVFVRDSNSSIRRIIPLLASATTSLFQPASRTLNVVNPGALRQARLSTLSVSMPTTDVNKSAKDDAATISAHTTPANPANATVFEAYKAAMSPLAKSHRLLNTQKTETAPLYPNIVLRIKREQDHSDQPRESQHIVTEELKRQIVETVEKKIEETVNRKLQLAPGISRQLTERVKSNLYADLVFERERWGMVS